MRLLANPIVIRMGLGLVLSLVAFVAGILIIRALRREMVEGDVLGDNLGSPDDAQYAYSAVIQQLKQQKFELQSEQSSQRRRAKTSEYITSALLANLPCGVLLMGPNGLVKQANASARQLLGFASPLGMNSDALFRESTTVTDSGESVKLTEAVQTCFRDRVRGTFRVDYQLASGEDRVLNLSFIPLVLPPDEVLGMACVVADDSVAADLRQQQLVHKEVSAEMALELRSSLSTIRDCAQRMSAGQGNVSPAGLVTDMIQEADRLEKVVGGFLAGEKEDRTFAAHA